MKKAFLPSFLRVLGRGRRVGIIIRVELGDFLNEIVAHDDDGSGRPRGRRHSSGREHFEGGGHVGDL